MKYKAGDKVRVVKINYEDDIKTKDLIGRVYEISTICRNDRGYGLYGSVSVWQENELELVTEEPTLFDRIKSAIIEAGKQAPIIIEQTEYGGVKISPINEDYLPIDTPCVVSTKIGLEVGDWAIRHYAGRNTCFIMGTNSTNRENPKTQKWDYIIPFDRFDLNKIEESLKYNIVK